VPSIAGPNAVYLIIGIVALSGTADFPGAQGVVREPLPSDGR